MKTKETILETYIRTICSNCKNKEKYICEIRKNIKGNLQCAFYEKDKETKGYEKFKGRTANQNKPIMKGIVK